MNYSILCGFSFFEILSGFGVFWILYKFSYFLIFVWILDFASFFLGISVFSVFFIWIFSLPRMGDWDL